MSAPRTPHPTPQPPKSPGGRRRGASSSTAVCVRFGDAQQKKNNRGSVIPGLVDRFERWVVKAARRSGSGPQSGAQGTPGVPPQLLQVSGRQHDGKKLLLRFFFPVFLFSLSVFFFFFFVRKQRGFTATVSDGGRRASYKQRAVSVAMGAPVISLGFFEHVVIFP